MAAGTLLSSVTTNTTGTGASHNGPCTVFVRGTFDGAQRLEPNGIDRVPLVRPVNC